MADLTSLAVFCGSRMGASAAHRAAAEHLGRAAARRGLDLIYGGGRLGLMGALADAALAEGGRVIGVIPEALRRVEVAHEHLTEIIVTPDLQTRKQRMYELAQAFAVLPGGLGTIDEAIEMITWRQLGLHAKPVFFVDIGGHWQPLVALIEHVVATGFAAPAARTLYRVVDGVDALLSEIGA